MSAGARDLIGLSIGQVARHAGVRPSAIRYYESEGLIPKVARRGNRRVYDTDILGHLLFVRLALRSGFRIGEIKGMVRGMTAASKPGERWRAVAGKKLEQLDRDMAVLQSKKKLLHSLVQCHCPSLAHFAHTYSQGRR